MTRYTRRIAHLSALASSLLLAARPTASGDALLATSPSPMGARAHGDRVVWGELSDGGWQLKTLQDGLPADLPISRFQGDQRLHLNVGPGEDGRMSRSPWNFAVAIR